MNKWLIVVGMYALALALGLYIGMEIVRPQNICDDIASKEDINRLIADVRDAKEETLNLKVEIAMLKKSIDSQNNVDSIVKKVNENKR